jgi:UDPglucose 6-dehydrogenase
MLASFLQFRSHWILRESYRIGSEASMANILIVGAGVVGKATGKGFAKKGHDIWYVDINPQTIQQLRESGLQVTTIDAVDWQSIDIAMLTVPTPSVNDRIALDYIKAAAQDVGHGIAHVNHFLTVVVRSTVPPGTTEQEIIPLLERASGKRAGEHFGVAMNPEFLRAVSSEQDFARPWITVLGTSDAQTNQVLDVLYRPFGALTVYCTPTEAELIKYVNNIYNAVKISYFNEVATICQRLNVDTNLIGAAVARSAESMWNPLYGTRGGVPFGGACLPKDTSAFLTWAHDNGFEHLMLEATISVNKALTQYIPAADSVDKIDMVLDAVRIDLHGSREELMLELGSSQPIQL